MKTHVVRGATLRQTVLAAALAAVLSPALASPNGLVISQVYGGGGSTSTSASYKYDFVELHNGSTGPISLEGMSVQYNSAKGTNAYSVATLPAVTLQAGQYFMLRLGSISDTIKGGDFAYDHTGGIAMSGSAGRVALVSNASAIAASATIATDADILDMVSYGGGTAVNPTEGTVAGGTAVNTAAIRTPVCNDTDVNGTDFTIGTPAPHSMADAPVTCSNFNAPIVAQCPASFNAPVTVGNSADIAAYDLDGRVTSAVITSAAVPGLSLQNVTPAANEGDAASATLVATAAAAEGTYPVTIQFGNDQAQTKTCTVSVNVRTYPAYAIPAIQGSGDKSPYENQFVKATGVVTAKVGSGFFLQDANGDGDPSTSDGVFVFSTLHRDEVNVGDEATVYAKVQEYVPAGTASVTELSAVDVVTVQSSGHSIAASNLGDLPDLNLSKYQGMLVHFNNPLYISQSDYLGSRGELSLSSGSRLEQPTNRYPFGSAEYTAMVAANAKNLIVLDDGLFVTPDSIPYLDAQNTRRAGDMVTSLTGVLDYGTYGGSGVGYKVQPTEAPVFGSANPRPLEPELAPGNVRVASANVLNFFTEFTNLTDVWGNTTTGCYIGSGIKPSNCRGADNLDEFIRQRDKIVRALLTIDADAYGLMEMQNNGEKSVNYLVESLNAAAGYTAYAAVPVAGSDLDGKDANGNPLRTTGTDAIRVAIIYKPGKLTLVGAALTDKDPMNNRAPVAATFKASNGGKFSLVVNHFRAKGSCPSGANAPAAEVDFGEGCWNQTRINQANRLTSYFLPLVKSSAGSDNVLVVGDLNAYGKEDPILALEAAGLQNQIERFIRPRELPHSYVFGHTAGYLDHALVSAALAPQVADVAEFHNNADEPEVLDYNLNDGRPQDFYEANAYRASDHDPVVVSLNLAATFTDVTSAVQVARSGILLNRATGKYTGTVTIKNVSSAPITGPVQLQLNGLPAGVTLSNASGSHNGVPYITVTGGNLAPGASASVSTQFDNPGKVSIGYTSSVFSGTF
ncbi:ExeM/NucH family extracellular endonuclease [Massilia arenosa]|uniref:ExeM/NucH family extracellular endonuclease n=1 Tax=Zemynaea arenosa TaxID=2561931 RepID=A0A4Y9SHK0_9BURK|nr:ExeM/NucH family extracellular endonuclease [Massilia arenosa]TFW21163.1 ExeM/NucH family extracellular endonuclease [Massilia arenosa]